MTAPTTTAAALEHERVVVQRGRRSGLPVVVAVHSTRLGPAVGGARMWTYPHWRDGLDDALRLSEAMSLKTAAAGLDHGGGKAVVALPPGTVLSADRREAAMLDLGDLVEGFGGSFVVGEDVGTTGEDMLVVRRRTAWAGGLPESAGGSGEPAAPTAEGVYASLATTARHVFGTADVRGRRVCVVGLGQVGGRLARRLAADGAVLTVSDVDASARAVAAELGATWVEPDEAVFVPTDLLVPAALGGFLRADTVDRLQCAAIVGPANNQLADDGVAELLAARGIVWAPDFIVNAGGVTYAVAVSLDGVSPADATAQVHAIGDRLDTVLTQARESGVSPLSVALTRARARIDSAPVR
jgi:leucine dehydrogenase